MSALTRALRAAYVMAELGEVIIGDQQPLLGRLAGFHVTGSRLNYGFPRSCSLNV